MEAILISIGKSTKLKDLPRNLDLESVSKLLSEEVPLRHPVSSTDQHKRGLVNLVGYGLKYLFGTDGKDVKQLNAVCDNLHTFQQDAVHETEQQLSYLRTLDVATKKNAKSITDLARTLRNSIQNYSLRLGRVEADLIDVSNAVGKQARYSMAVRETELAILEMKFSLVQLQESLDLASVGKLSNPHNTSDLLKQVSLYLPTGMSMLTGLTVEEMYVYCAEANVYATATSRSIPLFTEIPLQAADRYFELYEAHSLPFFHPGLKKFIKADEQFIYLAVAEDRQFFTTLTKEMLSECTTDFYILCPSNIVLRKTETENCLIALF
jgi:hypothetical protein